MYRKINYEKRQMDDDGLEDSLLVVARKSILNGFNRLSECKDQRVQSRFI